MRIARRLPFLLWACIFASPGRAQTQDIQQLKDRLSKLEQEMAAVKQQISAVEQAQKPPAPPGTAVPQVPAQERVPPAQEQVPKESEQTEIPPPPPNTFDLYGFAMLDSGYDFRTNDPLWFDVVRPTKLPAFRGQFAPNGKVYYGVRQTRFGVKSSTETPFGDLNTIFEFELFGTGIEAGQTIFRLRHAYGELGHFGAGQTWSPFMDIDVFPNSIEYWGPNGMVFFRNVQVRWTPIQGDSNVVFALERPGASADEGIYAGRIELQGIVPQFKWPDVSGHARLARKWGYVQVAGIFRKIAWVDTTVHPPLNLSGYAYGWGVNVSSNLNLTKDKNNVGKFQVVYGEGIENYMNDAPVDIGIKNNLTNPIKPILGVPLPILGVVAFLDHNWSERFSTSVGYSLVHIKNSDAQLPSDFHQGHYALGNLLYHPIKAVTMGGEFQWGRRVNFRDGFNVNDYRIQVSFKYDFARNFEY
jgi:DcaP outer membrane protein